MKCWCLAGNVGAWLLDLGPSPHVARESGEVALVCESSCPRPRPASHRLRELRRPSLWKLTVPPL